MKKFIKKLFFKKKQEKVNPKNVNVGRETLQNIKRWETQKNDIIIRSNFNRELYYKYLKQIKQ